MQYRTVLVFSALLLSIGCVEQQKVKVQPKIQIIPPAPKIGNNGLDSDEEQAVLNYHNQVRAQVGVPPLFWSKELAQHAVHWGQTLAAQNCAMKHSKDSNYGENLFVQSGGQSHDAVVEAAKIWESEKINYSGQKLNKSVWSQAGHYTQMVWRNTTQLGCAKVACNDGLIIVCNYNPAGNFIGKKPY